MMSFNIGFASDSSSPAAGPSCCLDPLPGIAPDTELCLVGLSNVIAIGAGVDHALAIRCGPPTPVITLQPTSRYVVPGSNTTFYARAQGLYGVSYQWQTNAVNLAGATSSNLTIANVQAANQGNYRVIVSDTNGGAISSAATLNLLTSPALISQSPPTNPVAAFQTTLSLSASVSAPAQTDGFPLSYQWKRDSTNIPGATTTSYSMFADATIPGIYSVSIANAAGSTTAIWSVALTYEGTYLANGTLAHHLATNAVARTNGFTPENLVALSNWTWAFYYPTNLGFFTNAIWSTNFWLRGVRGLTATPIGITDSPGGQGLPTMVSKALPLRDPHAP